MEPNSRSRFLYVPFAFENAPTSGAGFAAWLLGSGMAGVVSRSVAPEAELIGASPDIPRPLASELQVSYTLASGSDGRLPRANLYQGSDTGMAKTGLETLADIDEIS